MQILLYFLKTDENKAQARNFILRNSKTLKYNNNSLAEINV